MADSDIENILSDFGSSPHVGAPTPGPVRDLKSLLSSARQDRAPLESSNTSNRIRSGNQVLHPPLVKSREEFNGRTRREQYPRASIEHGQAYEETMDVDSRQGPWGMLSARLNRHDGGYSLFHEGVSDSEFDRQTVEAVQDSFRQLFAPEKVDGFFEEIIDVDREVGFGEDEDFVGQDEWSNASCDNSVSHSNAASGELTPEEETGEDHLQAGMGASLPSNLPGWRGELDEFLSDANKTFASTCDTAESGRERSGRGEDFMEYPSLRKPESCSSLSNQYLHFSAREDPVEEMLKSEKLRLEGDSTVDLDGQVNEEWLPLNSDSREEAMDLDHGRRDWELGSREVQLEEEVGLWKEKTRRLEQERNSASASQDYPLEKKPETVHKVVRDMLVERSQEIGVRDSKECTQEEPVKTSLVHPSTANTHTDVDVDGKPCSLMIMAFEDLVRESDERVDMERKTAQDVVRDKHETEEAMRQQHMLWSETEKRLESRINSLEIQHSKLSDSLREAEAALPVEKERRKESRTEVDRILKMLKIERKSHRETLEKLNTCVNSLMKLRGNLAMQKSRSKEDGGPSCLQVVEIVLQDMDTELQINLNHVTRKASQVDYHSLDIDELSRWKQQRDALEAERDKVEENMSSLLRRTRERHGEMEVLWLEREKLLEQKVGCLEVELQYAQMKQKRLETKVLAENQSWAEELEKCRKAWAHDRTAWEVTVGEREERLGAAWDCMSNSSGENFSVAQLADGVFHDDSSEVSNCVFKGLDKMCYQSRGLQDAMRQRRNLDNNEVTFDNKINQLCVNVENLASGLEAGVEKATEDLCSRKEQSEIERMELKEVQEILKKERQEMQQRVSETFALMEELKQEMNANKMHMEVERKKMQALLMEKAAEVEMVNFQLKSKEHDMEVTVQKFMDEVRLIDKEVEKERKEREQVMELHFASKRKVVTEMKEREEKWEREIDSTNQELENAKMEMRHKEQEIEELKRLCVRAPSEQECELTKAVSVLQHEKDALAAELCKEKFEVRRAVEEMLADVWELCEEEQIQAAVAKRLGPGDELSLQRPMWESLWVEYHRNKGKSGSNNSLSWQVAMEKIARLDKEILEATAVIETFRDELKWKNEQLLEAKAEQERVLEEREKDLADERKQVIKLLERQQQEERELVMRWQLREKELIKEKEAMEKSYKADQNESAETISNLQGIVRELEWDLKQIRTSQANHENGGSIIRRGLTQSTAKNTELVKVHASYLEEVDQYIRELEAKMEASEKKFRTPEGSSVGRERKQGGDPEMNLALMKIERELFSTSESQGHLNSYSSDDDRGYFSPQGSRDWDVSGHGPTVSSKRVAHKKAPRPVERNMCLTLNGLATLSQEAWVDGTDEHFPRWQLEDRNSLMLPRSSTEDLHSSFVSPAHGGLTLPSNSPSTVVRRQQKWVVDVSWLEQVRKEHAWLRQQLEIERQHVAALGRVEAENRWIEAAIIRALELKRESDSKVADMQRKVGVMEILMSKKTSMCSTP